ncbi:hypothetical protein AVEN_232122-1 [Araneus ventricosus]|uniref:Uncharacterized protein n=1 Tax=Araneus ventricosus TaxID=182803 RepID=A0A4Y2TCM5_ARAVE|nr:hypothetical protein AVEN_232122-1 [Araneus ventricosus]
MKRFGPTFLKPAWDLSCNSVERDRKTVSENIKILQLNNPGQKIAKSDFIGLIFGYNGMSLGESSHLTIHTGQDDIDSIHSSINVDCWWMCNRVDRKESKMFLPLLYCEKIGSW